MTSKDATVTNDSSDNVIVPEDVIHESIIKDNKTDNNRDGMAEYAAHYTESPPPYNQVSDPNSKSAEGPSGTSPGGSDASSRRNLKEPDGASGSSSSAVLPPKGAAVEKDALCQQSTFQDSERENPSRFIHTKTTPNPGIEEPAIPGEQKIQRTDKTSDCSKAQNTSIPVIPSTNIGVAFLVTLCFNLPLGALAIYFSLMATKAYRDGKSKKGAKKALISIYISLFSIVVTVLIVMAVVLMQAMKGQVNQRRYATKTSINL